MAKTNQKAYTPSRRYMTFSDFSDITKKTPEKKLGLDAPSNSLDISLYISHDCKIPRKIPTTIPRIVMNEDSIRY